MKRRPSRARTLREEGKAVTRRVRDAVTDGKKHLLASCPAFGGESDRAIGLLDKICDESRGDILSAEKGRQLAFSVLGKSDALKALAHEVLRHCDDRDAFERQKASRAMRAVASRRREREPPTTTDAAAPQTAEPVPVNDAA